MKTIHSSDHRFLIALVVPVLLVPSARAGLIDWNRTTFDPITGYAWLDLTETNGMRSAEVAASLGPGGRWEGFRYAPLADVLVLLNHAGITGPMDGVPRPQDYQAVTDLLDLLGTLADDEPHGTVARWSWGATGTTQEDGMRTAVQLYSLALLAPPFFWGGATRSQGFPSEASGEALGSFLYRLVGDMDADDDVDFDDIEFFVLGLTDPDGFQSRFGFSAASRGDTDGDASLDFDDVAGFVARLRSGGGSVAAVPEPTTSQLGSSALLLVLIVFATGNRFRAAGP